MGDDQVKIIDITTIADYRQFYAKVLRLFGKVDRAVLKDPQQLEREIEHWSFFITDRSNDGSGMCCYHK